MKFRILQKSLRRFDRWWWSEIRRLRRRTEFAFFCCSSEFSFYMFRKIGRLVFFVFFLNLHIHFPGCKLVCFSFVSATHFRFNLLLFFSPLFIFYCRLFCPGPSRLTFQNWVSRTETHRASRHVLSVMMMYKCVLERTGDTKRMSRLDFWIFGFFDFVVVFVFLIFVIFFFFLDLFPKFVLNVPPPW